MFILRSNNSLFAVPANQEFVHIHTKDDELADPLMTYLSQMKNNCPIKSETGTCYTAVFL